MIIDARRGRNRQPRAVFDVRLCVFTIEQRATKLVITCQQGWEQS